jgi:hypothetical protein
VLEMALDKFEYYTKAVKRRLMLNRQIMIMDTAVSIAGAFNGSKSLEKYFAGMTAMLESSNGTNRRPIT